MLSWAETATICGIITSLGVAIDTLMLNKHKKKLNISKPLLRIWDYIDSIKITDFPKAIAKRTLKVLEADFIFKGKKALYFKIALISALLTLTSVYFGGMLDAKYGTSIYEFQLSKMLETKMFYSNITFSIFGNLIFDLITTMVTIKVLHYIIKATLFKSIIAIILDIIFAFSIAILSLTLLCALTHVIETSQLDGPYPFAEPQAIDFLTMGYKGVMRVFNEGLFEKLIVRDKWMPATFSLYVCTMLIPTAIYLGFLLLLIIGKVSISAVRSVLLYIFERAIEIEDRIFTLTVTFVSLFGIAIKAIIVFAK